VILRLVYKLADLGVSNSKANVTSAIHDGLVESKIQIVPNFVTKPEFFTRKIPQQGALKMVCIANMHWYKNHKNLLVAISKVVNHREIVQLTLIGNGPLFKEIVMLSGELGVPVMFEGFVSNPATKLHDFDAAILVSYFEGSSNAVLEALVTGIPVISSNTGSVSELMSSGAPIIVCDPDSPDSIAIAITNLKENYEDFLKKAQDYSDFLEIELSEDSVFKLWSALILDVTSV
jgi:glycosyltransferase involved in cell wall biosynthesis